VKLCRPLGGGLKRGPEIVVDEFARSSQHESIIEHARKWRVIKSKLCRPVDGIHKRVSLKERFCKLLGTVIKSKLCWPVDGIHKSVLDFAAADGDDPSSSNSSNQNGVLFSQLQIGVRPDRHARRGIDRSKF